MNRPLQSTIPRLIPKAKRMARKTDKIVYIAPHPNTGNPSMSTFKPPKWMIKIHPDGTVIRSIDLEGRQSDE